jgi:arylsulfatase A-like enzyme
MSISVGVASTRPNVIVILADDLGWPDLGVQGAKDLQTPNINSLATNGVRFLNAYVVSPICSPSRAGLMAGRYPQRFGHEVNPGPDLETNAVFGLPLIEPTAGDRMKSLGYATGWIGKSHLGGAPQ